MQFLVQNLQLFGQIPGGRTVYFVDITNVDAGKRHIPDRIEVGFDSRYCRLRHVSIPCQLYQNQCEHAAKHDTPTPDDDAHYFGVFAVFPTN